MQSKLVKAILYPILVLFISPFVMKIDANADMCPGTSDNNCTKVERDSCTTTEKRFIPDSMSKYACETCKKPEITVNVVGATWINYPESGIANSAEQYVNIPASFAPDSWMPVHMYVSRLGCWGTEGISWGINPEKPPTQEQIDNDSKLAKLTLSYASPTVGVMSIKKEYAMSIDDFTGSLRGNQMNEKLAVYAANHALYSDPLFLTTSSNTLRTFTLMKDLDAGITADHKLRDVMITRANPYGRSYMQLPNVYTGSKIDLTRVVNKCKNDGQFDDDNYCDLEVVLASSVERGYALLDQVSYLRIKQQLDPGELTFSGSMSAPLSAKIDDIINFNYTLGTSYSGDVKEGTAKFIFTGDAIDAPSAEKVIGPINNTRNTNTTLASSVAETHKVTLADAQRGRVCRTMSWTSSAITPVPKNLPAGRSVQRCVTITPPTMNVSGTVTKAAPATPEANVGQAIVFRSAPNVTYSNGANSPVTYTLRTTSSATSTVLRTWTTKPGVQQTAFTSPSRDLSYTPVLADAVAGQVCRYLHWSYADPLTGAATASFASICVPVAYNYELTPSVKVPSSAEPGASITPEPKVIRVGDPLSVNSNWTLTRVILPASNTTDFGTSPVTNATAPSTHYNNLSGTVSELHASGSNIFSDKNTDLALDPAVNAFDIPGTLQLGQRVCFGLSVRPYTNTSTDYRHSALACATISKSPSAQIHGGGLLVAKGKVIGGSSRKLIGIDNKTFGSWVEYDITANGTVDQMVASAMGYGLGGTISGIGSHLQKLTFANKNVPYGVFGSANNLSHSLFEGSLTNPYSFFQPLAVSLAVDPVSPASLGAIPGQTKVYTHTGDITLNASTLPLGHQIVLIAENGNIYINGNQTYASGITDPKSLPQLVLIAHNGNIVINETVTNVDAWLIAGSDAGDASKGQLLTCHSKPDISTECDDQLVINGPVMVDYLKLYRIHGADFNLPLGYGNGGLNDPAEIFNLRPDAYIWSLQNSQSNTILKTTHIKDLAPRY